MGSFFLGIILARTGVLSRLHNRIRYVLLGACVIVILLFPYKTGFEYSVYDLFSGSANAFRAQQLQRDSLLSSDDYHAVLPAFSAFPNSTFNSDLSEDKHVYWNACAAEYYGLESVKVDYGKLEPEFNYQIDFLNPIEYSINIDAAQLRQGAKGESLYLIDSIQNYGPGVTLPYREIWKPITHKLAHIKVNGVARISDYSKDVHLMVVLTADNNQVLCSGSHAWELPDGQNSDAFVSNELFVHVDTNNHRAIKKVTVFILNPNGATVELSSMDIELY
jgi:hypothetical protein